jgi:hypothetical protein
MILQDCFSLRASKHYLQKGNLFGEAIPALKIHA